MSEWISVDDSLPPPGKVVLVYANGDYDFGLIVNGRLKVFRMDNWKDLPWLQITHWQPLPQPPDS